MADIRRILEAHPRASRDCLIPILQDIQRHQGYLLPETIILVGQHLKLPAAKVYGVATFYNQFRFHPPGKFHVQVCRGTACHVKGSAGILEAVKRELKIGAAQTTRDGLFSLEIVACVGACGLSPVLCVNGEFFAKVTPQSVKVVLDDCRQQAESASRAG